MNELELSNTQSIVFTLLLLGLLLYLNRRDRKKSAQIERESTQTIETTSEDLSPDYGRYIQLAGLKPWGY
nr:MAG TPA: Cell-membrane associated Mucin15 [Caudoviricetes sp.]